MRKVLAYAALLIAVSCCPKGYHRDTQVAPLPVQTVSVTGPIKPGEAVTPVTVPYTFASGHNYRVRVTAIGFMAHGTIVTGPSGTASTLAPAGKGWLLAGAPQFALIGRFSTDTSWHMLGASGSLPERAVLDSSDTLQLAVNAAVSGLNVGSYSVVLNIDEVTTTCVPDVPTAPQPQPVPPPKFSELYSSFFAASCLGCHDPAHPAPGAPPFGSADGLYKLFVSSAANPPFAGFDPKKLASPTESALVWCNKNGGGLMPKGSTTQNPEACVQIQKWVDAGAANN